MPDIASVIVKLNAALAEAQAVVTPPPIPAPTIGNMTATPAALPVGGGSVTINATVANATALMLDGVAVTLPHVATVAASHSYTLVASGPTAPPATASVSVTVAVSPPAGGPLPVITMRPLTGDGDGVPALTFWRYTTFERYERNQSLQTIPATGGTIRMIAVKMFNGAALPLNGVSITVTMTPIAGAPVVLQAVIGTGSNAYIPTPTLASGWYRLTATATGWQVPASWAYVPGGALPTVMPVIRANWEMMHPASGGYAAADCVVPAVFNPTTQPYPARVFESTTAVPSRATCVETQIVPCRAADTYRLNYAAATAQQPEGGAYTPRPAGVPGLANSFNRQAYNFYDLIGREVPMHPLLDGPRGKGTVFSAQHLWMGLFNAKVYFTDNWRWGFVRPDGEVVTLLGWRHKTPTLWTDSPQDLELVGDWSRVSGAQSINRCWGFSFDFRTLVSDLTAPPFEGRQPHIGIGPAAYVVDFNHKRILKAQFNGGGVGALPLFGNQDGVAAPCIVTEWVSSNEPFECVTDGTTNRLFVSERADNRIAVYNMDDRSLITSWTMPPAYPYPEGIFYQDGALYYSCVSTDAGGQLTGGQIRKRDDGGADSLVLQLTTPWIIDNNSRFVKFALSDGTFGPRNMLGLATWSGNGYGYPLLFLPNGSKVSDSTFPGQQGQAGPGLPWQRGSGYPSAVVIAQGRMVVSTMQEGLRVISKAQPTDVNLATPSYLAGRADYRNRGLNLSHGDDGFGFYGYQPPFGVSADIDDYLTKHGHVR